MEIGLFFFAVPFTILLYWNLRAQPLPETDFAVPPWLWACLIAGALLPRLWRLESLSVWPVADEGMYGYFATRLEQGWNWKLVNSPFNIAVPYSWILFTSFRLFQNSLMALWLAPALLGWGCLWFFPFLNRKIIPAPTAFYAFCWMAFGFWPLYLGRFSHQAVFFVFWECLSAFVLLRCLDSSAGDAALESRWRWLAFLTGLGFYTYLAWPMAAFIICAACLSRPLQPWSKRLTAFVQFGLLALLPAIPLFFSMGRNYHFYLEHLWSLGTPAGLWQRLQLPAAYFKNIFWGPGVRDLFGYGPFWGGLLNPVQTSLFFLGAAALLKPRFQTKRLWVAAILAVLSTPAFLTNNFEMMRLTGLLPLLAYVIALGTRDLLASFPPLKAAVVFSLVLTGSFLLDSHHLFQVYPEIPKTHPNYYGMHKSPEYGKAFAILKPLSQKEGPGLLLFNAVPDPYDQTLFVASYSFNAAENPRLDPKAASWAAVLANIHEEIYLSKVFPGMKWVWLSEGLHREDGGLMLAVVPIDTASRERIQRWARASRPSKD